MEKNIFNIIVPLNSHGYRIDKFLQSQINELSRTKLQALIRDGQVKLNNIIINSTSKKIKEEDQIKVNFPPPKETIIKPNKIPLDILYDDDDIIIINKSPGVVIHPGAGNYENTIVNGLLFKYKNNLSSIGGKLRPGIVHRIDKGTSGAIVVAKNDNAHISLSKQFSNHSIKRVYEALVWGSLIPQNGKISEKISRSVKNRQLMAVRKEKGKIAITNYKTLKVFQNLNLPKISLVECQLETGRTHQIRVHLSGLLRSSILCDPLYGNPKEHLARLGSEYKDLINDYEFPFLHAKVLGLIHPITKEKLHFEVDYPSEFKNVLNLSHQLKDE